MRGFPLESSFFPYEEYDTVFETRWIYNTQNSGITHKLLEDFVDDFKQYEDALTIIDTIVDEYWDVDEPPEDITKLGELAENYKTAFDAMERRIGDWFECLDDLSHYNIDSEACNIISDRYGMVAYDGALDHYAQKAVEEATEKYESLIRDAEPIIRDILDHFPQIIQYLTELEETLQNLLVVNSGIDNTGVG